MSFNGFYHKNRYLLKWNHWIGRRLFNANGYLNKKLNKNGLSLKNDSLYRENFERDACGVGMIANLNNDFNRNLILSANEMLVNMAHRGACGLDEKCGDGAGILTNIPHSFFTKNVSDLPAFGHYGTGNIMFGKDLALNQKIKDMAKHIIENEFGFKLLHWRHIPVNSKILGVQSAETEPIMEQIFITIPEHKKSQITNEIFERNLLLLRNILLNRIDQELLLKDYFFICSLSNKTITYKGQLTPQQLFEYFGDLQNIDFVSNFALVHSRFSTNTFPSWDRAQPNRISCHNGEINTLRGNKNWMHSRSGLAKSSYFDDKSAEIFPICSDTMTDSGNFDSVLETLTKGSDLTLPEIVISMVPEAWQNDKNMSLNKKLMYEYLSCKIEPWDGPALIAFCDGNFAGAVLDRNGLRPSRYYITNDKNIIFSSEIGVLPNIDQSKIIEKGRLEPGKIFLIDLNNNRIIRDNEFKDKVSSSKPYKQWLSENLLTLNDLVQEKKFEKYIFEIKNESELSDTNRRLNQFGFTTEVLELLLVPMFVYGKEALGSMGNDSSLAVLSSKPKIPFEYFKQLFAQVTNPPIDPIRESLVMTLKCPVGPELNIFETKEGHCKRLTIDSPILNIDEMNVIKNVTPADQQNRGWKSLTLDCTFRAHSGKQSLIDRLNALCIAAENAITKNNVPIIVLSDKKANDKDCAIPSLLTIGAIHHHLIDKQLRSKVALFIEAGDAKEVHDFCTLLGYGADGICPYMVYRTISKLHYEENIEMKEITKPIAIKNYISAINKGILKVMSKMGISTLQSYKGAQVFEAIGLNDDVVIKCFKGTESRIKGTNFDVLYTDMMRLHEYGHGVGRSSSNQYLRNSGDYNYRIKQEEHFNTPQTITALQNAVRLKNKDAFNEYSEMSNIQASKVTLRGLLKFNRDRVESSIPIDQVEPASEIMHRFNTGAMSLGSISRETHETLAQAMNTISGRSNTGEGGEDPIRFSNNKRSAIKQVASGRFGVTINYLTNADQIQIKMAQGAKPGEGGELPGSKVSDYIGRIRHTTPGVQLISPPPHHDIYSIEDLSQLIFDLKQCNPSSEISVKLVSEIGVGIIAAGVAKAKANHITISGHDGGTGASAWTGIKNGGVPWELGLSEVQQTLVLNGLRDRVKIQTDGQLKTGRDVVIATLLGAEEYGFATAPLIALGCIMMRKCHLNTCPVGIATQDPELRKKFEGQPDHVVNFFYYLAEDIRSYMASLGFETMNEMVGRTDYLKIDDAKLNYKSRHINLNPLLFNATKELNHHKLKHVYCTHTVPPDNNGLDKELIELAKDAIDNKKQIKIKYDKPISNLNRTAGATLSNAIAKKYGDEALPDNTILIEFNGYGGQSFCCGLAKGITIQLEGDANDYVGKLMSGGTVAIYPPLNVGFPKEDANKNTIVGNACLYGATSGKAFFNGKAGERFAVRNSGATAVVEGVGDHGCEYMTGGRVIILGEIGKNFAAGMSGGIAYIFNLGDGENYLNKEMIGLEFLDDNDIKFVKNTIEEHYKLTQSDAAKNILDNWEKNRRMFTKIMPNDYKRVLLERQQMELEKTLP